MPDRLSNYNRTLRRMIRSRDTILQYSRASDTTYLWMWFVHFLFSHCFTDTNMHYRPLDESGNRLKPADFNEYRKSHYFRGPLCLCSLKFENQTADVEAPVYVAKSGICLGEYVSSCAQNNCDYFSQSDVPD